MIELSNLYVNNKLYSKKFYYAKSLFDQIRGLMFSKKKILLFDVPGHLAIHTFFCFFPITLVYIKSNKVVESKCLAPFTFYYKNKDQAEYLFEIPGCHTFKKGDLFEFRLEG